MQSIRSNDLAELRKLRGLVIDMDGVLWHGDTPMPGLHGFFDILKQRQIKFVLATNNNTQTPEGFVQKAGKLGVEVSPEQVVTAAVATVHYLCSNYPPGSRIYVLGEAALKGLISTAGFTLAETNVSAVVATMDRQLTYEMLKRGHPAHPRREQTTSAEPDPSIPHRRELSREEPSWRDLGCFQIASPDHWEARKLDVSDLYGADAAGWMRPLPWVIDLQLISPAVSAWE
jgi:ribonucleotide monophosphatase NagD (HAD superfamily)